MFGLHKPPSEICISSGDLPISLAEIGRSVGEIGIFFGKIHISLADLYIPLKETPQGELIQVVSVRELPAVKLTAGATARLCL